MNINKEILNKVVNAINKLLKNDSLLLKIDANERSISHKFAEYLQSEFPGWNVDCEYNRDGFEVKELKFKSEEIKSDDTEGITVFPDIIVHIRNSKENLLIIEVKKSTNKGQTLDEKKLRAFTSEYYNYKFGLFLKFYTGDEFGKECKLNWYMNGKKIG